jgi:hypothetical protein
MAKIWKEEFDAARHSNRMDAPVSYSPKIGGLAPFVYFVRVCSFTIEFHSIEQINLCLPTNACSGLAIMSGLLVKLPGRAAQAQRSALVFSGVPLSGSFPLSTTPRLGSTQALDR